MNTSSNQQQQPGTNMFGGGSGLFGNQTTQQPQQQMQQTPGLFGTSTSNIGGGNLFGQPLSTQQQPQSGMIGSGIFQNKPQQIQPTQGKIFCNKSI